MIFVTALLKKIMNISTQLELSIERGERLHDLDLRGINLANANLSNLSADRLDFCVADIHGAKLCSVRFNTCRFEEANFEETDCSRATLRMCVFDSGKGARADFDNARIEDCSAKGAILNRVSLRNAKLTDTSFERAVLREAVFDNAEGDGVEFRGADLSGASLVEVRFDEADFRGADLRGADLSRGRFHSADFRGAILDGTRFDDADCGGSWFDEGVGPYAEARAKTREKHALSSFDEIAVAALWEELVLRTEEFTVRDGVIGELMDRIQTAMDKLNATVTAPPEEWKPWLELLMNMSKEEHPPNIKAVLDAVCEGTDVLRNILTKEEGPASEILVRLQHVLDSLENAGDQPPEEWKVWLEPLMKMANEGRPLEVKALLDVLAALAQSWRLNPDEPQASQSTDAKDGQE